MSKFNESIECFDLYWDVRTWQKLIIYIFFLNLVSIDTVHST